MEPLQFNKRSHDGPTKCSVTHQRPPRDLPECAAAHWDANGVFGDNGGDYPHAFAITTLSGALEKVDYQQFQSLGRPGSWRCPTVL